MLTVDPLSGRILVGSGRGLLVAASTNDRLGDDIRLWNSGSQQLSRISNSRGCMRHSASPEYQAVKLSPNVGRPLFDSARAASSCRTSRCSANTPSVMRTKDEGRGVRSCEIMLPPMMAA
jgi:hypothetical protein